MMSDVLRPSDSLFKNPPFIFYFVSRFLSSFATQMSDVGLGWLVYERTRSAFALGLVGLMAFAPKILLSLWAGHAADRFERRIVLAASSALMALCAVGFAEAAASSSNVTWPIFLLVAFYGSARAFYSPASQAIVPNLVSEQKFPDAVAAAGLGQKCASIAGPAIGGLAYAISPVLVFGAVAFFCATAAFAAFATGRRPAKSRREPATWSYLTAGIAYVRRHPILLGAVSLDLFAVLLGGATALLPIYARDIFHTGPWGLGLLRATPAAGAVASSLFLAWRPLRRRIGLRMFQSVFIYGLGTIVFGFSRSLLVALPALFALGAADMVSVYIRGALAQMETPNEMRGRVAAVNSMFVGASNELGEFESGFLAGFVGAVAAVLVGGFGTLLVAALWMRLFPQLTKRETLAGPVARS